MRFPTFYFGFKGICTYCGDPSNAVDHVIPVAFNDYNRDKRKRRNGYGPMTHVCSHCNSLLGSKVFETFLDRAEFVRDRIELRTKAVNWSKAQMRQLDNTLRTYIEASVKRRLWFRQRADWFGSRDFFLGLESLMWTQSLIPTSTQFHKGVYEYFRSAKQMTESVLYLDKR